MEQNTQIVNPIPGQQPRFNRPVKKSNLVPIIVSIAGVVIITLVAVYFFVIKADPKIKIQYSINGDIEQKGTGNYELLYKTQSIITMTFDFDKLPDDKYVLDVNGSKSNLDIEQGTSGFQASYKLTPEAYKNSYFDIKLTNPGGKTVFTDNLNIILVRPNISAKEFIENYLKTYSMAVQNKNSSDLMNASSYWLATESSARYETMRRNFSKLTSMWYDNVISSSEDDVSAKVNWSYNEGSRWTYVNAGYKYILTVVKSPSGIPEWKISKAIETIEKTEHFDFEDVGD
ncbi:MAG: hypothetical protein EHM58_14055 [Ignavibacteriae bacterium]|nr:MAG: hypothetical protein EHM58_14055 [Ignavibacteriota bacterium]